MTNLKKQVNFNFRCQKVEDFTIFAVYFLYFSLFVSMQECDNIVFTMDYIFLVHVYTKMSQMYENVAICFSPCT